ncbi:hypothetical protein LTR37_016776 [Vermiconidia calcicola]|uniref:Uncharacterized protein n=1 Tax=Vermiconidia calcicola TaxID=1690605 RepID=A0ACC3MMQ9_9PEZI|nr:hypothetical protein LTR37_016776 [Vermiconidia calcicola]
MRPLPIQLLDHCTVCIEEQLYSQAFSLLSDALTSGTGSSGEAHIPPTQHLALAATLVVHPQLTTRTTSPDKQVAADDALRYLRHVNSLTGPRASGLDQAFRFCDAATSIRGKRTRTRVSGIGSDDEDEKPGRIRSPYVEKESLWTNAEGFCDVLGWAFNCSIAHRHRWDRWKLWLDLMLEVLQDDLEARLPEAEKLYEATGSIAAVESILKDSMFSQHVSSIGAGRNNKRRLMRAVLADGKQKSLAEFGEIWKHEAKAPKQKQEDRSSKRRKLDLENGDYGDYFDNSDEDSLQSSIRRSRSVTANPSKQQSRAASKHEDDSEEEANGTRTPNASGSAADVDSFGGMDALHLRQRILALLTLFCSKNPEAFLDTEDLLDLYTEFLRPLPLAVFQQFVLPTKPWLGPNSQASLVQMLLRPLLVQTAPPYNENALRQAEFEAHYAPFAANSTSYVDNAKVSLMIESLLRLLWSSGKVEYAPKLRRLVEQGIQARKEKAAWDGRKKVGVKLKADADALLVMECSAERMLTILDMAE